MVSVAYAQENVASLNFNGEQIKNKNKHTATTSRHKTTALNLPFFEDFTSYSGYPDNTVWTDREIYINNTMCVSPVSWGVATFDGLNADGIPYEPNINIGLVYADSLTSMPIDLSSNTPADSIYLSFFTNLRVMVFILKHRTR